MRSFISYKSAKFSVVAALCVLFASAAAAHAFAATLGFSPAGGTHAAGSTFTVNTVVSTQGDAINAISGVVHYPTDLLQVVGISKASSVLTLWVQDPSFSNADGTVSFEGVVPNPGFTGNGGTVAAITFKVLKEGAATVKYDAGSVLANDGNGTNVLETMNTALYTLVAAPVKPAEPAPIPEPAPEPVPAVESSTLAAPVITAVTAHVTSGTALEISGTATPGVTVTILFSGAEAKQVIVIADADGRWSYSSPLALKNGTYSVTAQARDNRGTESLPSAARIFDVHISTGTGSNVLYLLLLIIFLLLLIILYLAYRLTRRKHKVSEDVARVGYVLEKSFSHIKGDLDRSLKLIAEAKARRSLTVEEEHFMDRVKKNIQATEEDVNQELEYLHKRLD